MLKINKFRLSPLTLGYSLLLIISASFMRQLLETARQILSRDIVVGLIWVSFIVLSLLVLLLHWREAVEKDRHLLWRLAVYLMILMVGLTLAGMMDVAEERIHLVKYGLLGYLISRDNGHWSKLYLLPLCLVYCLAVASIDETFQYFLPYRVGDLRDVAFGGLGGLWGFGLYLPGSQRKAF